VSLQTLPSPQRFAEARIRVQSGLVPRGGRGPLRFLIVYLALLYLLPARLVIRPLGTAGTPAILMGAIGAMWWTSGRLTAMRGLDRKAQPVRFAIFFYAWFMLLTYALGHLRTMTLTEINAGDKGLVALVSLTGTALLAADGIHGRAQLDRLLRYLVGFAAVMAFIGLVQFATSIDPVSYIRVPGLSNSLDAFALPDRGLFNRPFGTALHPIEFSVVCASVLPLAIHFARFATTASSRRWNRAIAGLIALGVPISLSRSGVLSAVPALLILGSTWTWRQRAHGLATGVAFVAGLMAVFPGLVGTIKSLFINATTDPSVTARTARIPKVLALIARRPWFGIGYGSYNLRDFFLLDNEVYRTVIESGLLGLIVVLMLVGVAIACARVVRRSNLDPETQHLAMAMIAFIVGMMISTYTFDAFFYRILTGSLFLVIGCTGALWRIERQPSLTQLAMAGIDDPWQPGAQAVPTGPPLLEPPEDPSGNTLLAVLLLGVLACMGTWVVTTHVVRKSPAPAPISLELNDTSSTVPVTSTTTSTTLVAVVDTTPTTTAAPATTVAVTPTSVRPVSTTTAVPRPVVPPAMAAPRQYCGFPPGLPIVIDINGRPLGTQRADAAGCVSVVVPPA
jgi:O-antigen ligase